MADSTSRADQIRSMTEQMKSLRATQAAVVSATRTIQDIITFHDHPDVVALDDELDIMYRGQM